VTRRGTGLALACLLASAGAWAQERPRRPGAGAGREEALRMVDAYIVSNLQESLGLTDPEFEKLLPLVRKLQKDRRELAQHRRKARQDLKRTLAAGGASEAQVLEQLKALKAIEVDEPAAIRKDVEAVDSALSPIQQARFRVMEVEIEARIREMLSRVRAARRMNKLGKPEAPAEEDPEP